MTVSEALEQVQFVVGPDGQPTAALIDIATWQVVVSMLEEAEDQGVLRNYLARRRAASSPEELGLIPWEQVEAALDAVHSHHPAPVNLHRASPPAVSESRCCIVAQDHGR